jgi:hypothetical protein
VDGLQAVYNALQDRCDHPHTKLRLGDAQSELTGVYNKPEQLYTYAVVQAAKTR